jgi:hypothetical protein
LDFKSPETGKLPCFRLLAVYDSGEYDNPNIYKQ